MYSHADILSRAPTGSAQGRLHAEVSLLEFSVPSPPSQGYRPGIGCRWRMKGLGTVLESLAVGRPKPGLSLLLLLLHSDIHSAEPPLFSPIGFTPHRVATTWAQYKCYECDNATRSWIMSSVQFRS